MADHAREYRTRQNDRRLPSESHKIKVPLDRFDSDREFGCRMPQQAQCRTWTLAVRPISPRAGTSLRCKRNLVGFVKDQSIVGVRTSAAGLSPIELRETRLAGARKFLDVIDVVALREFKADQFGTDTSGSCACKNSPDRNRRRDYRSDTPPAPKPGIAYQGNSPVTGHSQSREQKQRHSQQPEIQYPVQVAAEDNEQPDQHHPYEVGKTELIGQVRPSTGGSSRHEFGTVG